jgi:hypothetical protein
MQILNRMKYILLITPDTTKLNKINSSRVNIVRSS